MSRLSPKKIWAITLGMLAWSSLSAADPLSGLRFAATLDSIRIYAGPGDVVVRSFRLTTEKDQRRAFFRARTEDWWPSEDGRQSFYRKAGTLKQSCAPWVALNPVEAIIEPGETLDLKISVSIPQSPDSGGYWCVLTVDEILDPTVQTDGITMRFLASVSVGIFVYIEPVERAAQITNVSILPDRAEVRLTNQGNSPLGVEGRIEFRRPGEEKPAAVVQINRRTVVPEPVRTVLLSSQLPENNVLPSGRYLVRVILDIGLDSYIGVEKVLEVSREPTPVQKPMR